MNKQQILGVVILGLAPLCTFAATDALTNSINNSMQVLNIQPGKADVGNSYASVKAWRRSKGKHSKSWSNSGNSFKQGGGGNDVINTTGGSGNDKVIVGH